MVKIWGCPKKRFLHPPPPILLILCIRTDLHFQQFSTKSVYTQRQVLRHFLVRALRLGGSHDQLNLCVQHEMHVQNLQEGGERVGVQKQFSRKLPKIRLQLKTFGFYLGLPFKNLNNLKFSGKQYYYVSNQKKIIC